jgi:hypothetical protein
MVGVFVCACATNGARGLVFLLLGLCMIIIFMNLVIQFVFTAL